jgi:hypothetical protein
MRIILGLWLLQAVSAGSAWLALSSTGRNQVIVWIGVLMGMGLLAALWIGTALRDQRRLGEAQRSERMANGAAELHAKLARQRAEDAAKLTRLTEKMSTTPRVLKTGLVAGGAIGLGLALMLTQFLTLGLLAIAFAGGGVAGYAMRGRLDRRVATVSGDEISVGTARAALPAPRGKRLSLRSVKANAA